MLNTIEKRGEVVTLGGVDFIVHAWHEIVAGSGKNYAVAFDVTGRAAFIWLTKESITSYTIISAP